MFDNSCVRQTSQHEHGYVTTAVENMINTSKYFAHKSRKYRTGV